MAIYKIFPTKDTTLYSLYPNQNTGLDSILEIHNKTHNTDPILASSAEVARALVSFNSNDIINTLNYLISGSQWQANLKIYNAKTTGIVNNTKIYIYPLAQDWANGTGKQDDNPKTENGASWTWSNLNNGIQWNTSSFGAYITASFLNSNPGGGIWYTGSSTGLNYEVTQSFDTRTTKDINSNITNIVSSWYSSSLNNYGLIIKWGSDIEYNQSLSTDPNMNLFSVDTHTIYPPELEFRWNDYIFNTGSNNSGFISSSQIVISFPNNRGIYNQDSVYKFRLNTRPQYPTRVFQTSSFYISNYYLPTSSYYAIKDLYTDEFVIDFDDSYTKISADNEGNYFKIFMSGLQPERYYKILVKTIINGETLVFDDEYYFKIING